MSVREAEVEDKEEDGRRGEGGEKEEEEEEGEKIYSSIILFRVVSITR